MAARRPFLKWHRWKSIGFCLWPPSTCIWNLKLKFQSKLDLCSGNHVVYRQTDGQGESSIPPLQLRQTPWKLFMLSRTENQLFTIFVNFKHGYIKKFYWSSHIFHWSSHFFIGRGPRTDKFRGVCFVGRGYKNVLLWPWLRTPHLHIFYPLMSKYKIH